MNNYKRNRWLFVVFTIAFAAFLVWIDLCIIRYAYAYVAENVLAGMVEKGLIVADIGFADALILGIFGVFVSGAPGIVMFMKK